LRENSQLLFNSDVSQAMQPYCTKYGLCFFQVAWKIKRLLCKEGS
jgi:hypothetical protein